MGYDAELPHIAGYFRTFGVPAILANSLSSAQYTPALKSIPMSGLRPFSQPAVYLSQIMILTYSFDFCPSGAWRMTSRADIEYCVHFLRVKCV
jgi:hypothetical protein